MHLALVGTPNSGKTSLFNALTGSRQKVANYPGVTVERKEGFFVTPLGRQVSLVDLPGTYSLRGRSPDEEITRDFVLGRAAGETPPDLVLCVADSTNLRLTIRSSFEEAQDRAEELVKLFDLGLVPAERLVEFMEQKLSLQVVYLDIPEGAPISGAFCHLNDLGAILVNRNESEGRRSYDLAHELFHALTWDFMEPEHRETNSLEDRNKGKRIEQLADNFAAALLMPLESLKALIDPSRSEDAAHYAEVAARLQVTTQALGWRLFNLKWISDSTRAALSYERPNRGSSTLPNRFSLGFAVMLHKAIDEGRLSARKAAKALGMNLTQLAALFPEHGLTVPFEL